ncbi:hypothetical protein M8J76_007026 [Diaphorina citri]|nr:hypothetical protein M8J76_007026 [Diaphorina citri]
MTFCIVNVLQRSSQLHRCGCILISRRTLTSNEVATALRPFYFNVHPDLFGQFPNEREKQEMNHNIRGKENSTLEQKGHSTCRADYGDSRRRDLSFNICKPLNRLRVGVGRCKANLKDGKS